MRFKFTVEMDDGETIAGQVDARDVRRWEAMYSRSIVGEKTSFTSMTQMVYLALRREGSIDSRYPTYDIFDQHCVDLKTVTEEGGGVVANPTQSEATEGLSPTSPSD